MPVLELLLLLLGRLPHIIIDRNRPISGKPPLLLASSLLPVLDIICKLGISRRRVWILSARSITIRFSIPAPARLTGKEAAKIAKL
jgi:hypothetical protein